MTTKTVPIEPTEEMIGEFFGAFSKLGATFADGYKAMIAAAPPAQAQGEPVACRHEWYQGACVHCNRPAPTTASYYAAPTGEPAQRTAAQPSPSVATADSESGSAAVVVAAAPLSDSAGGLTIEQIDHLCDNIIDNSGNPDFAVRVNAMRALAKRALSAPNAAEPVAWNHSCDAVCTAIDLWIDRCPHCGRPRTLPAAKKGGE